MSQMTIRSGSTADVERIGTISFEAHSLCRDWSARCPNVKAQDWVDVQKDLVLQHLGSANDVVIVAEDDKGGVVGYIYGRIVGKGLPGMAKKKTLEGQNTVELAKMSNAAFVDALIEKYGRVLCKSALTIA